MVILQDFIIKIKSIGWNDAYHEHACIRLFIN